MQEFYAFFSFSNVTSFLPSQQAAAIAFVFMRTFQYNIAMNYIYGNQDEMNRLLERFTRYVKIWSESDGKAADQGVFPSTERQWDIAKVLVKELRNLGTRNVYLTDYCYVVARSIQT